MWIVALARDPARTDGPVGRCLFSVFSHAPLLPHGDPRRSRDRGRAGRPELCAPPPRARPHRAGGGGHRPGGRARPDRHGRRLSARPRLSGAAHGLPRDAARTGLRRARPPPLPRRRPRALQRPLPARCGSPPAPVVRPAHRPGAHRHAGRQATGAAPAPGPRRPVDPGDHGAAGAPHN